MRKSIRFIWLAASAVAILLFGGSLWGPVLASNAKIGGTPMPTSTPDVEEKSLGKPASAKEQAHLKSAITAYFELRYKALSVSQPQGFRLRSFGTPVSKSAGAKAFRDEELAKFAVDLKNAQLNGLRYVNYKYSLNFQQFTLDASGQKATVRLSESNEVIYESSQELNPAKPLNAVRHTRRHTHLQ